MANKYESNHSEIIEQAAEELRKKLASGDEPAALAVKEYLQTVRRVREETGGKAAKELSRRPLQDRVPFRPSVVKTEKPLAEETAVGPSVAKAEKPLAEETAVRPATEKAEEVLAEEESVRPAVKKAGEALAEGVPVASTVKKAGEALTEGAPDKPAAEKAEKSILDEVPVDPEVISPALEDFPTTEQFENELKRITDRSNFMSALRSTIFTLVTVAAIAVLVAVLLLPILRIYGTSMAPTLTEGNIVVSVKGSQMETGDLVAFYYNNKILVKRVIAHAGDWVDIDEDGTVYVNSKKIDEPYVKEPALGQCDIDLPYQVPEGRLFVMGDHRSVSVDSRNTAVGCVAEEQIVGKIVFCVWPVSQFGSIR